MHQATDGDGNRVHGSDYSQYMGSDNSLNAWFDPQNTQSDLRGYADINVHYSLGTDEGSNRVCPTGTVHIYNPAECQVQLTDSSLRLLADLPIEYAIELLGTRCL